MTMLTDAMMALRRRLAGPAPQATLPAATLSWRPSATALAFQTPWEAGERDGAPAGSEGVAPRSRRIAFHEAGHGVVAWALDIGVGGMRIDADAGEGGCDICDARHLAVVQQLAICYAGVVAGTLSGEPAGEGEGEGDRAMAQAIVRSSLFRRSPAHVHRQIEMRGHALAGLLIARHRAAVTTLAEALLARDLDQAAVAAMLARAPCRTALRSGGDGVAF
jgi:hypothetical protein